MKKIVEYELVRVYVNKFDMIPYLIGKGWQPYGSPILGEEGVIQAMVKYGEDEPTDNYQMPGFSDKEINDSLDNLSIRKKAV